MIPIFLQSQSDMFVQTMGVRYVGSNHGMLWYPFFEQTRLCVFLIEEHLIQRIEEDDTWLTQ